MTQNRASASEAALLDSGVRDIAAAISVATALQIAGQCLRQLTPATVYALFEYDSAADLLICHTASGDDQRLLDGLLIKLGERVTGWSAANHRTSVNSDASLDLAQIASFFTPPLRSTLSTPLVQGDRLIAVLTAYSPKMDAFNASHRYTFEQVSTALVSSITAAQSTTGSNVISFPIHNK